MVYQLSIGDAPDALAENQQVRAHDGVGVLRTEPSGSGDPFGCKVRVGSSGDVIETVVGSGAVRMRINGNLERVDVPEQTVIHDTASDQDLPRKDTVCIGPDGTPFALAGDPSAWPTAEVEGGPGTTKTITLKYSKAGVPAPPSTAGMDVAVVGVVSIDSYSNSSSDLTADHVQDRRIPATEEGKTDGDETQSIPISAIENGGTRAVPIICEAGRTINLYKWGCAYVDDASLGQPIETLPSNVNIELVDPSGTIIAEAITDSEFQTGSPIVSEDTSGKGNAAGVCVYRLRLHNGSGEDISPPAGLMAYFNYEVV